MNIGIIVHSQTGNTQSVVLKLKDKLSISGNKVELKKLNVVGGYKPGKKEVILEEIPELEQYDIIFFASPVQGFSLSPVMDTYLKQIHSIQGKNVGCLMTQLLPFPFLGGNRAIGQMKKICIDKGATIFYTGIVNWSKPNREENISKIINNIIEQLSTVKQK